MHMQASAAISSDLATVHFPKQEKKKKEYSNGKEYSLPLEYHIPFIKTLEQISKSKTVKQATKLPDVRRIA